MSVAAENLGPHVLFLIARFALEDRKETEKPNTAPHRAFLAYRPYAMLVENEAQKFELINVAVRLITTEYRDNFILSKYQLPNSQCHRGGNLPAVIIKCRNGTIWYQECYEYDSESYTYECPKLDDP